MKYTIEISGCQDCPFKEYDEAYLAPYCSKTQGMPYKVYLENKYEITKSCPINYPKLQTTKKKGISKPLSFVTSL